MFDNTNIQIELLKKRAFNLRWASVPEGVIPLTAADPDFPSAPEIADAISAFAKDKYYCYGAPEGMSEFKESIAHYFHTKRQVPVSPAFAFPVNSAAHGIYLTCKAFLQAGDEAIIFDPVDFLFRYSVEAMNAKAVTFAIPAGTNTVNFEAMEALITPKTKMICLCNPLNPTGKVFTKAELTQLANIVSKHGLLILSDEIWSDIVFEPAVFTSVASIDEAIRQQTITITGFSKSYGLAGLRIGAVIAHNEKHFQMLMDASLHYSTVNGVSVLSQVAATTALNQCDYWLKGFVNHLSDMKNLVVSELNTIPGFKCIAPEGCYVAFTNITQTNLSSQAIYELLLNEAKVAVVPGLKQWFGDGAEGHIRMSFATSETVIREAMQRIKGVVGL
jgi:aminotransferase